MLVERKDVLGGFESDHHRLYHSVRPPKRTEILVHAPDLRAFVEDLHPGVSSDNNDVVFLIEAPKEGSDRDTSSLSQTGQGGQTRRGLSVLNLRNHAQGKVRQVGKLGHGHT